MLATLVAAAALTAAPPLHLRALLDEAHAHNPTLQAARAKASAAHDDVAPAGAFDDPTLTVQLWNVPANLSAVPVMAQLTQHLPLGNKRGLRREAAEAMARVAGADVRSVGEDIDRQVKAAYFDLYLATRTDAVDADIATTLETITQSTLSRLQVGMGSQSEVLRAQAAQIQLQAEREVAQQRARSARVRLAALLDRPSDPPQGEPPDPLPLASLPAEAELATRALQSRPELAHFQDEVTASETQVHLARALKIPDLGVSLGAMHTFGGTGETNFLFAGLQVNLPIFSRSKNAPRIDAALARAQAARDGQRALRARIQAQVADAYAEVQSEQRLVTLHHHLIPLTREALQSALHDYARGKGDFPSVIDTVHALQKHQIELAEHRAAYAQHLADLEQAVGAELGDAALSKFGGSHAER